MNRMINDLEEIRLRNLRMSRDVINRKSHYTDDELSAYFLKIHEDLRLISFVLKRLIDPFEG